MNIRHLEYILTIYHEKGISKAAKKLYVSQPYLSQLLMQIESEIGAQLFKREVNNLSPTYAGEQYIKAAQSILDIQKNLSHQIEDINMSKSGRITIGIAPSRSSVIMPYIIPAFLSKYPQVEISFIEEAQDKLDELLIQGKIDLSFTAKPFTNDLIVYENLYNEHILLALPTVFLQNNIIINDIKNNSYIFKNYPFILVKEGNDIRNISNSILKDLNIKPNILLESNSLDICLHMCAANLGATFIPSSLHNIHFAKDKVICYKIGNNNFRQITVAYKKNIQLSFLLKEFIEISKREILYNLLKNDEYEVLNF